MSIPKVSGLGFVKFGFVNYQTNDCVPHLPIILKHVLIFLNYS